MLLRHATLARNLASIIKAGLLTGRSQGKLPVVWVCCRAKTAWAALHTVRRHGGRVEAVVILEIDVPRRWLRRSKKGLWDCPHDIPPDLSAGSSPSPRWPAPRRMGRTAEQRTRGGESFPRSFPSPAPPHHRRPHERNSR